MSDQRSLLPTGSTALERAMEQVQARPSQLPVPLRELWRVDDCPSELLPWLAWSLSLDSWQPYWSDVVKRERIRSAVEIQRRKGTAKSVRDTVASFGGALSIREWWQQEPQGEPHTFELTLTMGADAPTDPGFQQDIVSEIERTKPVRSHFSLTLGLSAAGGMGLFGAAQPISYRRLQLQGAA